MNSKSLRHYLVLLAFIPILFLAQSQSVSLYAREITIEPAASKGLFDATAFTQEQIVERSQIYLPLTAGGMFNQATTAQPSQNSLAHNDGYWAELAQDYPAFEVDPALVQAASLPHEGGRWGDVIDWPHIPVTAATLPDGRILTWASNERTSFPEGRGEHTYTATWDPATSEFVELFHDSHDMFCASQVMLEDGRVFVTGGRNYEESIWTSIFDYRTNTWTRVENMNAGRWYPTSVVLPDDKVFVALGGGGGAYPELYTPGEGWALKLGINFTEPILSYADLYEQDWWPILSVAPNGKIFHSGPTPQMHWIDPTGNGSIQATGAVSPTVYTNWYPKQGATVMYDEGKLLVAGGAVGGDERSVASPNAMTIDISGETPIITPLEPMVYARTFNNSVVMANGEVVVIGGNYYGGKFSDGGSVLTPEVWNPETQAWRPMNNMAIPRNYHSVALLMADGRVFSGGGGLCDCQGDHPNAQIFEPPYLFKPDGTLADRPTITNAPAQVTTGQTIALSATPSIQAFNAVRMSAVTHSINPDLRFLHVPFRETEPGSYQLDLHENINVLMPGYWMLFALDVQGVPSVAHIFQVSTSDLPTIINPGNQSHLVGESATLAIEASDPNSDPLTFSATNLPTGLAIETNTGIISGMLESVGTYSVTVTVDDLVNGSASTTFLWAVTKPANNPPILTNPGDQVNTVGASVSLPLTATDADDDPLTFAATGLPLGLSISTGTGFISGSVGTTGSFTVTVTVSDGQEINGEAQVTFGWIVNEVPNTPPQLSSPGDQSNTVGDAITLNLIASDEDDDALAFGATGLPTGLMLKRDVGQITGTLSAAGSYPVTLTVDDGHGGQAEVTFNWQVAPVPAFQIEPFSSLPQPAGTVINFSVTVTGGRNLRYSWLFGDGGAETVPSTSPSTMHTYAKPGLYMGQVTVTDVTLAQLNGTAATGETATYQFYQAIYEPLSVNPPTASSSILLEAHESGDRIWNVNPDNDTVSVFHIDKDTIVAEISVGQAPRTLIQATNGQIWVTNRDDATLSIIDPLTLQVVQTLPLPRGSAPYGIAAASSTATTEASIYVVLEGTGQLLRFDEENRNQSGQVAVGPNARHLSISGDGSQLLVSRFITPQVPGEDSSEPQVEVNGMSVGGKVLLIKSDNLTVEKTIILQNSFRRDAEKAGRGIPNYLGAAVISPSGGAAWVPSKQDNILRGTLRDGNALDFDHTVRSVTSFIDLTSRAEIYPNRVDHDNAGVASSAIFDRYGNYLFVALESNREVAVIDTISHKELFRFDVGRAPQGLALSSDGLTLYVHNFMDRTVTGHDLTELILSGEAEIGMVTSYPTVATEELSPQVLLGKQLFYDAADTRLAKDSYMSCAACHNDGGHDGRVWDMTSTGEGLRNTISLQGHAGMGQGRLHWSGNFDEIQDFEGQIRDLAGGTGLMADDLFHTSDRDTPLGLSKAGLSAELDALAAYVSSLTHFGASPYRAADGSLTPEGIAGKQIFQTIGCVQCHLGNGFTDSAQNLLHDIGTIKPSSGKRLSEPLTGLDTPTLLGLWATAPYLHDGSAATLAEAVAAHEAFSLSEDNMAKLVAYLQQIDDEESPPVENGVPMLTRFGEQGGVTGDVIRLTLPASDPDGDPLRFSGSGLPDGLQISPNGLISGTLTTAGRFSVSIQIEDGRGGADAMTFIWVVAQQSITQPTNGLSLFTPSAPTTVSGQPVRLLMAVNRPLGGSLLFGASDLPPGLEIATETGEIYGVPNQAGEYRVTVVVQDEAGNRDSVTFDWIVLVGGQSDFERIYLPFFSGRN